ncbi:DUF3880 domain-containing protein [Desulfovibrio sp. OttesenSCG-928-I05]|nr:DUF3880 domain-containing protein [Desulfovibrio sp. OttesenSCG-928-I05]
MRIQTVLTPDYAGRLVAREAAEALTALGLRVTVKDSAFFSGRNIARLFALPPDRSGMDAHPDLFFTVNFHGLDREGEQFAAFERAGVPVAVWLVDNPWNQLSGLRSDFWKKTRLFVTDDAFVAPLRDAGAVHVRHLPLAANPAFHTPADAPGGPCAPLAPFVFVGRSAFPDKERFFVGLRVDEALLDDARALMRTGERPDFDWWARTMHLDTQPLWPGGTARRISLGAEESSAAWRTACLAAVPVEEMTIFGDEGWRTALASGVGADACVGEGSAVRRDLRPPVDYYGVLPRIYRAAEFSLNMTSFLLPRGLTQRHFDVWTAGGFLLTDATPGLELFPDALTRPITFSKPEDIPVLAEYFRKNPEEKRALAQSWRQELSVAHGYTDRMRVVLADVSG